MQMQDVNFKSVNQFLEYLPSPEIEITTTLRQIILETMPTIHEKLSWNIPTYAVHKSICFIWPSSIKWGKKSSYTGVRFGFSYGNLLANHQNYFELGNRKQVSFKTYLNLNEIDVEILKSTLLEAIFIDEQMALTKKMNNLKSRK
jgi:hypothetical protein